MPYLQNIDQPILISKKVAIVGSSAILNKQEYGKEIDKFNTVIRFNRAPTEGFEKVAGSFTSLRLINGHVYHSVPFKRWKEDDKFVEKLKDSKLLVCSPDHTIDNKNIDISNIIYRLKYGAAIKSFKPQAGNMPTIGLIGILLVVQSGAIPHVYGWSEGKMCHYYNSRNPKGSNCHHFPGEWGIIKSLKAKNKIILH
jgi:hypothetical protein